MHFVSVLTLCIGIKFTRVLINLFSSIGSSPPPTAPASWSSPARPRSSPQNLADSQNQPEDFRGSQDFWLQWGWASKESMIEKAAWGDRSYPRLAVSLLTKSTEIVWGSSPWLLGAVGPRTDGAILKETWHLYWEIGEKVHCCSPSQVGVYQLSHQLEYLSPGLISKHYWRGGT